MDQRRVAIACGLLAIMGALSGCGPTMAGCMADGRCQAGSGGAPAACTGATSRFVDLGQGAVADCTTTFVWQAEATTALQSWANAATYCAGLSAAGEADWALPTLAQLQTILLGEAGSAGDYTGAGCRTPGSLGGNCWWVWSATEVDASSAWGVDFQPTGGAPVSMRKTNVNAVRCVRNVPEVGTTGAGGAGGGSGGTSGTAGAGGASGGCVRNADCGSPRICKSGMCQYECSADSDCSVSKRCSAHVCQSVTCGRCQRVSDHRCVDCGSGPYGCYC